VTRSDLQPLPKESETRIEWVRARHEVKIRSAFLNWHTDAEKARARPPTLTAQQQSELQALLVARSVELGEAEGRERLSAVPDPSQLEVEIHCLVETVADEARDRWKSLTSAFHLEASTEGVYVDAERGVHSRVRELLGSPSDRLILQAWSAYEKRLQAECGGDGCSAPLSATPEADTRPGPVISGLPVSADRRETLGQKVERLRIDKGMTLEKLALDADVDKKTVLRITNKGKRANPGTLKKLADALGVTASYLTS
jgi:DNA-binding XRE family transcriptional regulator